MVETTKQMSACCIGHREIAITPALEQKVLEVCEKLICEENVEIFYFGSKSAFNSLCYDKVTELRGKYPHIRRVFVRGEFPEINQDYQNYLLERYEATYYPEEIQKAGRAV